MLWCGIHTFPKVKFFWLLSIFALSLPPAADTLIYQFTLKNVECVLISLSLAPVWMLLFGDGGKLLEKLEY